MRILAVALLLLGCTPIEGRRVYGPRRGEARVGSVRLVEEGLASWYGMQGGKVMEHGKLTASGTRYDQNAMTAAHKTLPLGTRVRVTRTDTGRSILVVVNDRGPYVDGRIIDLTMRGARMLGFEHQGTAPVRIEALP